MTKIQAPLVEGFVTYSITLPNDWVTIPEQKDFLVGCYFKKKPDSLVIAKARIVTHLGLKLIELIPTTLTSESIALEDDVYIYPVSQLSLGDSQDKFYTVDLVTRAQNNGKLKLFRFWKVGIQSGLEFGNTDSYGVFPLKMVSFELDSTEVEAITSAALKDEILRNPLGTFITP